MIGLLTQPVHAQISPITTCDAAGIGGATLVSNLPTLPTTNPPNSNAATITAITAGTTGGVPYCLVCVQVPPSISINVGLPTGGRWNCRLQSEGGGGYAGSVGTPTGSIAAGYIGVQNDAGHAGGSGTFGCANDCVSDSAASPGGPDVQRQADFAYRSEHLMAVLGKQLAQAFYAQQPVYSYWNGCSTGVLTLAVVVLMTWFVAPQLTKLFKPWLFARRAVPGTPAGSSRR